MPRPSPRIALLAAALAVTGCNAGLEPVPDPDTDTDPPVEALIGILVTPERVTVPVGQTAPLRATGLREDRTTVDLTFTATWHTSDAGVAEVGNGLDAEGEVRGVAVGKTEVWASVGEIASPRARVAVTEATLLGLTVRPAEITIERGKTVQLAAEAGFSDGTRSDASAQVLWEPANPAIVTLEAGGRLTAVGVGATTVRATWGEVASADIAVQVRAQASPDLRFSRVTAEAAGGYLDVRATVENAGDVGAADLWIDAFADRAGTPGPGDLGDDFRLLSWLGPGETADVRFQLPVEPGARRLVLVADIDDEIPETDETNNVFAQTITVAAGGGGPNLTLPYFDYIADGWDDLVLYAIEAENTGSEAVGPFFIDVWYDAAVDPTASGLGDDYLRVEGLRARESISTEFLVVDFSVAAGCASCRSWLMVDTNDEVEETFEDDNVIGPLDVELF